MYNMSFSDVNINKVEFYFVVKYVIIFDNSGGGIVGDYIVSDGMLIWDVLVDGSYYNEIIVIGRDDMFGLY